MHATIIFRMEIFRDMGEESEINVFSNEGCERSQTATEGIKDFEESVEGVRGII